MLGMIIMRGSYGGEDPEYNKKLAESTAAIVEVFFEYSTPGRLLVTTFHSLRHIPSWFPGAGWKRVLENLGEVTEQIMNEPFNAVEERMVSSPSQSKPKTLILYIQKSGTESGYVNLARELLESLPDKTLDKDAYAHRRFVARNVAAQAYIGTPVQFKLFAPYL
jgi:hypothetical protein